MQCGVLTEADIASLVTMEEAIQTVREAMIAHGRGEVQMPSKLYLDFGVGDLRTMPVYWPQSGLAAVKLVNVHPDNAVRGLPAVMATTLLFDPSTGCPLAILSATALTDLRTGAVGAVAAVALARPGPSVVGLIGCGRQARSQLAGLALSIPIQEVKVAGKTLDEADHFCQEMTGTLSARLKPVSIESAAAADIVVTTTPSRTPIIQQNWIRQGTHINAIGADAPGKQELDPEILKEAVIIVDDLTQAAHSGEINRPLASGIIDLTFIEGSLGELLAGLKPGRLTDEEITLFDSTGLAILDLAVANVAYQKAIRLGVIRKITL